MDGHWQFEHLQDVEQLTDPRRLSILRYLMREELTLTALGDRMGLHPAKVRYHLKRLEKDDLVRLVRTEVEGGNVRKYYRASAAAYTLRLVVLPHSTSRGTILAAGSDDPALNRLAKMLCEDDRTPDMITIPQGSLNGLVSLRQGLGQMAGIHLYDAARQTFHIPYVTYFFPDRKIKVVHLNARTQGLVVAQGNPLGIRSVEDILREDVRFINRNPGSGTHLWLKRTLAERGISSEHTTGFQEGVRTHKEVVRAVARQEADAGIAVLAALRDRDVDYIPLYEERYDLVIPEEDYQSELLEPVLDTLHSASYRNYVEQLPGVDARHAGRSQDV